jgi:DNA (cytosine-5)-methyltransferase 1
MGHDDCEPEVIHTALDLFCGAGGASIGIEQAGFELVAAIDADEQALQTHNENLPAPIIKHDLSEIDPSILSTQEIDYIHGSPPCQGFSNANDERNESDPRNRLVFDFIEWVQELQPAVVSMENVTGMLSITTEFMGEVESAYREAGYNVKYRTLNAADYGVPQIRNRVYTIAIREGIEIPQRWFPKPTHSKCGSQTLSGNRLREWLSVEEAFCNLSDVNTGENHTTPEMTEATKSRIKSTEPGESLFDSYKERIRLDPSEPAPTLKAGKRINYHFAHPVEPRKLTIRERARIMGFPDWFTFTGPVTEQRKQTGNAVPPPLQRAVASQLKKVI